MDLPGDLFQLVLAHFSRHHLISLLQVSVGIKVRTEQFFARWAQELIHHDAYFAQLPVPQVVQYLKYAHLDFVPDEDLITKKINDVIELFASDGLNIDSPNYRDRQRKLLVEVYRDQYLKKYEGFSGVPKFIQANDEDSLPFVMGTNQFYSPKTREIFNVVAVDPLSSTEFYFLFADGSVRSYHGEWKALPGRYTKIAGGLALSTDHILMELSMFSSPSPFIRIDVPLMIDFDFHEEATAMGEYIYLTYITIDHIAYYSENDETRKLCDNAKKVLSWRKTSIVLLDDRSVLIFYKGQYIEDGPDDVIDMCHLSVSHEDAAVLFITARSNICYYFNGEGYYFNERGYNIERVIEPRLYQELSVEDGKYIIAY